MLIFKIRVKVSSKKWGKYFALHWQLVIRFKFEVCQAELRQFARGINVKMHRKILVTTLQLNLR